MAKASKRFGRIKVKARERQKSRGKSEAVEAAGATAPTESAPGRIKVKALNQRYRGARESWYARLKEFDGKTYQEFITSCKERPPALTKAHTAEDPKGWFNFFKRHGIAELVQ